MKKQEAMEKQEPMENQEGGRGVWQRIRGMKRSRKALVLAGLAVVLFLSSRGCARNQAAGPDPWDMPMTFPEIPVERGSVRKTIYVTGHAAASSEESITSPGGQKVQQVLVEPGQTVRTGDLLYTLESTRVRLDYDLRRLEYEKLQRDHEEARRGADDPAIRTPLSGEILALLVTPGTPVQADTVVARVENRDRLLLRNAFSVRDYHHFQVGDPVRVFVSRFITFAEGTVVQIDEGNTPSPHGGMVRYLTVEIGNPGSLQAGDLAKVQTEVEGKTVTALAGEPLSFPPAVEVKAGLRATVTSVHATEGQLVYQNTELFRVDPMSASIGAVETRLALEQARAAFEEARDLLERYEVRSPVDGRILEIQVQTGDLTPATGPTVVIGDVETLIMRVIIDEYDVHAVYPGQTAEVYFTALGNEPFAGTVTMVGQRGQVESGTVTFRAEIAVANDGRIRPGMSGDADIFVERRDGVLRLPREAVTVLHEDRGIVQIPDGQGNLEPREVRIGVEGDTHTEILDNLREGETVALANAGYGGYAGPSMERGMY